MDVTHSVRPWVARTNRILVNEVRRRSGREDSVRSTAEMNICRGTRFVRGRRDFVETETSKRSAWEVDVRVEGWRVLGHESNDGRGHHREPEWRMAHKDGLEEDSEGKMGTK